MKLPFKNLQFTIYALSSRAGHTPICMYKYIVCTIFVDSRSLFATNTDNYCCLLCEFRAVVFKCRILKHFLRDYGFSCFKKHKKQTHGKERFAVIRTKPAAVQSHTKSLCWEIKIQNRFKHIPMVLIVSGVFILSF